MELDRTVEKAIDLIEEAAAGGADVIGFPEGFVPGHPGWVELLPLNDHTLGLSKRLFQNAVEIPGAAIDRIAEACGRSQIAAIVGVCERRAGTTGTLFNTQVFIDPEGRIAEKHQKFVPTIGERLVHGPGTTGTANSLSLDRFNVTGLICGENSNPLAQYAAAVAYPSVHIASWPQHFSPELEMQPVIHLVSKGLAYTLKSYVVNSVTTVSEEMVRAYGEDFEDFLASEQSRGRASVVAPSGTIIAEADSLDEQLLLVDVDEDAVIIPKFIQDTAGHYNRPELFEHLLASSDN